MRRFLLLSLITGLTLSGCNGEVPVQPKPSTAATPVKADPASSPSTDVAMADLGKLSADVFARFKTNFPDSADFQVSPVVIRIVPSPGQELFEILTPHGPVYTDRQATWMVEGVLMMQDPSSEAQAHQASASAAGLPSPLINVTLREDSQRLLSTLREKEDAMRAVGAQSMSLLEIYKAMPRDRAIVLDYGTPTPERDVVMLVDIEDPTSHDLFVELSNQNPAKLNFRLSIFPVSIEEIHPTSNSRAAALLCSTSENDPGRVQALWKSFLSDSLTAANPSKSWGDWATTNGVVMDVSETCPRQIDPGVFTRLASSLGLSGSPRAVLSSGRTLMGKFSVKDLLEALSAPPVEVSLADQGISDAVVSSPENADESTASPPASNSPPPPVK